MHHTVQSLERVSTVFAKDMLLTLKLLSYEVLHEQPIVITMISSRGNVYMLFRCSDT